MTNTAKFILSLDFELGWGCIEKGYWRTRENKGVYDNLRAVLPVFLSELDAMEIPVTWAFVGAMMTPSKDRELGHLPEGIKDLTASFTNEAKNTTTDARDLLDMILNARTDHKLSSHTYSHVRFNHKGVDESFIKTEMQLFKQSCNNYDIKTDSLVFPQNIEGFHDQIKKLGFATVRTAPERNVLENKIARLAFSVMNPPPLSSSTMLENGLLKQSGSMFYNTGAKRFHRLPFIYKQAISGINRAIRENGTIHIWIHPFNLSESTLLLPSLLNIMKYVSKKRDQGLIEVATF